MKTNSRLTNPHLLLGVIKFLCVWSGATCKSRNRGYYKLKINTFGAMRTGSDISSLTHKNELTLGQHTISTNSHWYFPVKYSTDIIGSCAFGLECNSFEDPNSAFLQNGRKIFQRSTLENLKNMFMMSFPYLASFLGLRLLSKDVSDFYYDIVRKTVTYRKKNNVVRPDFLQLLIEILQDDEDSHYTGKLCSNKVTSNVSTIVISPGFDIKPILLFHGS